MSNFAKEARRLERLYDTAARGIPTGTVLRFVRQRGSEGAEAAIKDFLANPPSATESRPGHMTDPFVGYDGQPATDSSD
jgi:hypothetical protein